MEYKFKFDKIIKNIEQVKRELPKLLANDAQNYFLKSFQKQEWDGKAWKEVKRRISGTTEYAYPMRRGLSRRTKPILMGTGRLRQAVANTAGRARISYSKYNFRVVLTINKSMVPYAQYLNDGTDRMPKRQFMGNSWELRGILRKRILNYTNKAFK